MIHAGMSVTSFIYCSLCRFCAGEEDYRWRPPRLFVVKIGTQANVGDRNIRHVTDHIDHSWDGAFQKDWRLL